MVVADEDNGLFLSSSGGVCFVSARRCIHGFEQTVCTYVNGVYVRQGSGSIDVGPGRKIDNRSSLLRGKVCT